MEEIVYPRIIAVEGVDECNFFAAFLKKFEISNVQPIDFKGKTNFPLKIQTLRNRTGFEKVTHIALIRDSDNLPPISAFDSIVNALRNANLPYPTILNSYTNTNPSVGIFIMPNNIDQGMLEDLCLDSIMDGAVYKCIEQYFECINDQPEELSKAKILCYLASKIPLRNSIGLAALKGHWNFEAEQFRELREFIFKLK